jgi:hypothetical protein
VNPIPNYQRKKAVNLLIQTAQYYVDAHVRVDYCGSGKSHQRKNANASVQKVVPANWI